MNTTPAILLVRKRFGVKIDHTPGAAARAISGRDGRKLTCSARRNFVVDQALQWQALGYPGVQVSFHGSHIKNKGWRDFPVTQDEAIAAVRDLADRRRPGWVRWQNTLDRLDQRDKESAS